MTEFLLFVLIPIYYYKAKPFSKASPFSLSNYNGVLGGRMFQKEL